MSERDLAKIQDQITESGLVGRQETDIIDGVCQRLTASGAKVMRVQIGQRVLHPIHVGIGFRWQRGKGNEKGDWGCKGNQIEGTDIANSPFGKLLENQLESQRFKIEGANEELSFPILHEFSERGETDSGTFVTGCTPEAVRDASTDTYPEGIGLVLDSRSRQCLHRPTTR